MALAIDASTPAITTQTNGATATLATGSFSPPANALLYVRWAGNTQSGLNPSAPSITNSGTVLTWTRPDWISRATSPNRDGQAAHWWGIVGSSAPGSTTVTVTSGAPSGSREAALRLVVITGHDPVTPIGQHGGTASSSATGVSQNYTGGAAGSWGFLGVCDWDVAGVESAGSGNTLEGSAAIASAIDYAFDRRTTADGTVGGTTSLITTIGATSANLNWVYAEIMPLAATGNAAGRPLIVAGWSPTQRGTSVALAGMPDTPIAAGDTVVQPVLAIRPARPTTNAVIIAGRAATEGGPASTARIGACAAAPMGRAIVLSGEPDTPIATGDTTPRPITAIGSALGRPSAAIVAPRVEEQTPTLPVVRTGPPVRSPGRVAASAGEPDTAIATGDTTPAPLVVSRPAPAVSGRAIRPSATADPVATVEGYAQMLIPRSPTYVPPTFRILLVGGLAEEIALQRALAVRADAPTRPGSALVRGGLPDTPIAVGDTTPRPAVLIGAPRWTATPAVLLRGIPDTGTPPIIDTPPSIYVIGTPGRPAPRSATLVGAGQWAAETPIAPVISVWSRVAAQRSTAVVPLAGPAGDASSVSEPLIIVARRLSTAASTLWISAPRDTPPPVVTPRSLTTPVPTRPALGHALLVAARTTDGAPVVVTIPGYLDPSGSAAILTADGSASVLDPTGAVVGVLDASSVTAILDASGIAATLDPNGVIWYG